MNPPAVPAPLLTVRDLTVSFDRAHGPPAPAVRDVSFSLHTDQTLAIVGESGSGKSVTAMSILRLLPSPPARTESGRVLLASRDPGGRPRDLLSMPMGEFRQVRGGDIAMIFQEPMTSLNPLLTVGDQIGEAVRIHAGLGHHACRERAVAALEGVGISDARSRARAYPHEFSGGMRQRVMIAMALACEPRVLLADEPTTALDVTTQAQILDLIDASRSGRDMGVVLITHDLGVVARRADVLCVMYAGRVVEYGATGDVLAHPLHPYTRGLLACRPTVTSRRERLTTVPEALRAAGASSGTDVGGGAEAWWPAHRPPPGVTGPGNSVLVEPRPGRWVRAWATPAVLSMPRREPDLPVRRSREVRTAAP